MSAPEDTLAFQLKAVGIPFEREVQFAKPRRWRADFVVQAADDVCAYVFEGTSNRCFAQPEHAVHHGTWQSRRNLEENHDFVPDYGSAPSLLIEIDGGSWVAGRHTTGAGFERDCEKLNAATLAGYRVLRFLPEQVTSGVALQTIEQALR